MDILQIIMVAILIAGLLISIFGICKCTKGYKNEDSYAASKSRSIIGIGSTVFIIALIFNIVILLIRTL